VIGKFEAQLGPKPGYSGEDVLMSARTRNLAFCVAMCIIFVLTLSAVPGFGQGQSISASLNGTVMDQTGKAVNGAKVTLTSPSLGITHVYDTDDNGFYSFTLLPAAVYKLEIEAPGFKRYGQDGITLTAGQSAGQNVTLTLGAVTENIEVTSQAPLLNSENANIASDISARQVEELPLNLRNVIGLAVLNSSVSNAAELQIVGAPGISGTADQDVSFLNFGGTFFNTAEYLLDGSWDTRLDWGGVLYVPSVDDVEVFKIQTNAFTAQYGFSSGNVINVVTKSGSNQFHGDAYEFYRNSSVDAKYVFNSGAQPKFKRNQFGGTIGGPIQRDKTFFFGYYEGLRSATPATFLNTVPTDPERTGNFSALLGGPTGQTDALGRPILSGAIYNPFSTRQITKGQVDPVTGLLVTGNSGYIRDPFGGNIIPANLIDTIAGNIAKGAYWPHPTNSNLINNFNAASAAPSNSNEYSIRIDHNFSDRDRIFGRWSQKYQSKINSPTFYGASDPAGPGVTAPNNRYSAGVGYNRVFSPTLDMALNFGVNRHVEQSVTQSFGFKTSTLGLPGFIDSIAPSFPQIQPQSYAPLGAQAGLDNYIVPQTVYTSSVDFTKVKGKHTLAFGFMDVAAYINGGHYANTVLQFQTTTTAGPDPQQSSAGTGNGFASFLLGAGSGADFTAFNQFPVTKKHLLGWYLQDDWKITRRFTLNLGMRYEIQTAPAERTNAQQYFDFTAVNPISSKVGFNVPGELVFNSSNNRGLYHNSHKNFAPRLGAAYQLHEKIALRAGYGIFYVPSYYGQGPNIGYSQGTPWVTTLNGGLNPSSTLSGNAALGLPSAFPNGAVPLTGNSLGGLTGVGLGLNPVVNRKRNSPYVQQWMAGVQYSITNNDLVDLSYVGNHGVHVLAQYLEWNELPVSALALGNKLQDQVPNPFFGSITQSGCGLNNATVSRGQLLLPFPQFCSVTEAAPAVAGSSYNALEATYTHRWHSGLQMGVSYTYSKFIDNAQGSSGWAFPGSGSSVRNSYNLAAERSLDASDLTHSLVINYTYELPFGKGKQFGDNWNTATRAVLGGWQWSGIVTTHSGLPISINPAQNNAGGFGFNQRANIVPGVSPIPQNQSINNWINPAAFSQPAPFTFGDSARFLSSIRAPGYFNWDMGIQKYWNFTETKRLQFRLELYNALNHPNFFVPDTNLGDANFGHVNGAYPARSVQFAGKFYF
jgi:hypothetical protein